MKTGRHTGPREQSYKRKRGRILHLWDVVV
jgi:hypothetical protein